jgi:hypothetical protein
MADLGPQRGADCERPTATWRFPILLACLIALGVITVAWFAARCDESPQIETRHPDVLRIEGPGPAPTRSPPNPSSPPNAAVVLVLTVPDAVPGGSEFSVSVAIADRRAARGSIDVHFDPGVMSLADATVRYDSPAPGVARLYVETDGAVPFSAMLQFAASHSSQAPAIVLIAGGELVSAEGRVIGLSLPPAARIVVAPP